MNKDSEVLAEKQLAGFTHFIGGVSADGVGFEYKMAADFGGKRLETQALMIENRLFLQQGGQVVELTITQAEHLANAISRCMPRVRARLEVAG